MFNIGQGTEMCFVVHSEQNVDPDTLSPDLLSTRLGVKTGSRMQCMHFLH